MRIVFDARYVGPAPSGIGTYVQALINRLPALAPESQFRVWTRHDSARPLSSARNVQEVPMRAGANGWRSLMSPTRLDRLDPGTVAHFPSNTLGRGVACATVVTVHDLMWLEHPEYIEPGRLLRLIRRTYFGDGIRRALGEATRILTGSQASADQILRIAPGAAPRLRVVHDAVEGHFRPATEPDAARARAATLLGTDAPFFLVVGRNQPSKAHGLALEAFAGAAKPHERLVLTQRQHGRRGLSGLVKKLGIADRVIWKSTVAQDEMVTLMQSATALLQPSLAEGFGLPALEAIACGCPVVASDIAPLREVLGGAGALFPPGEAAGLARGFRRIADEPALREELRQKGLERARAFNWDATARATLEVYGEAERAGPRASTK